MKKSKIYLQDLVSDNRDYYVIGCLHLVGGIVLAIVVIALIWASCLFT